MPSLTKHKSRKDLQQGKCNYGSIDKDIKCYGLVEPLVWESRGKRSRAKVDTEAVMSNPPYSVIYEVRKRPPISPDECKKFKLSLGNEVEEKYSTRSKIVLKRNWFV